MSISQKNSYRRFVRAARKAGAVSFQKSYHGCSRISAQAFDSNSRLVLDWNL